MTLIVPVTFGYKQQVFPKSGYGKIDGTEREWLATVDVALPEADAEAAVEVATLAFTDGASFVLRRHEGVLYRPVFAPGTHEPCDLAAFARASEGNEAWLDCPFKVKKPHSGPQRNTPPKSHRDGKTWPEPEEYRKTGWSKQAEREREVALLAADLLVVDGIVHRPCKQPVLALKSPVSARGAKPETLRLTWVMDGLECDDDPFTGPTTFRFPNADRHAVLHRNGNRNEPRRDPPPPVGPRTDWTVRPWRVFGICETDEAIRFGQALADLQGTDFEAPDDLVQVLRDWALAPHPKPPLKRFAKEAFAEVAGELTKLSRASVNDWLDARDAGVATDPQAVLECLSRVLDRPDDRALMDWNKASNLTEGTHSEYYDYPDSTDAMAGLVRYDVIERHRDHEPDLDAADAAALSSVEPAEELEGDPDEIALVGIRP